jgi:hypothetical protein
LSSPVHVVRYFRTAEVEALSRCRMDERASAAALEGEGELPESLSELGVAALPCTGAVELLVDGVGLISSVTGIGAAIDATGDYVARSSMPLAVCPACQRRLLPNDLTKPYETRRSRMSLTVSAPPPSTKTCGMLIDARLARSGMCPVNTIIPR